MEPWLIWVLGGLLAAAGEMLLPGAFLLWIGLAAIGTGLVMSAYTITFAWQVAVFVALLVIIVAAVLRLKRGKTSAARINTPDAGLAGRIGFVTAADPAGARVRIGDSDWSARAERGAELPQVGSAVQVVAVDGTTLIVRARHDA